jgi:hypothetical protein
MKTLVAAAIAEAGLGDIFEARRAGNMALVHALLPKLEAADLLALGALADEIRKLEVGAEVRVFTSTPAGDAEVIDVKSREIQGTSQGLVLLRDVAIARITGPAAARVRVDATQCGIQLGQVALGFGASELAFAPKRVLPMADEHHLDRRELTGLIERAGRRPSFSPEEAT